MHDDDNEEVTLTGSLWAGRFDVVDRLGEGAMGTVYRARHLDSNSWVALKRLHPEHAGDPEVVARFNREMKATAGIHHPNTCRVIDFGAEDGYLFLAMEIVEGKSLDEVVVDDCPMEPERVAHIGSQIAAALEAAHDVGFAHRDLKPENILLTFHDGDPDYVKVLDFGLAGILDEAEDHRLTNNGLRVGTPMYMPPEYIEGKPTDHRGDLYSLGVVLYMLATGQAPFKGSPYAILEKAVSEYPKKPSEIMSDGCAPWLESLIMQLMAKDPDQRIQTAAEVSQRMADGREAAAVPRPDPNSLPPTPPSDEDAAPAFSVWMVAAAAAMVAVIGFLVGFLLFF